MKLSIKKLNFIDNNLRYVLAHLACKWYFVGGVVRDTLLGYRTKDIDIVTTATPQEIRNMMKQFTCSLVGQRFGTIGVFYKGWQIEITTTRFDINPDGRHTAVEFSNSFEEDVKRRDFTINALLMNINGEIIDFVGGIKDIKNLKIKFIGDPKKRIEEDYLRIFRYIRFFSKLTPHQNFPYLNLMKSMLNGLKHVSIERIWMELKSMAKADQKISIQSSNNFFLRTWRKINQFIGLHRRPMRVAVDMINKIGISKYIWNFELNIQYWNYATFWEAQQAVLLLYSKNVDYLKISSKTKRLLGFVKKSHDVNMVYSSLQEEIQNVYSNSKAIRRKKEELDYLRRKYSVLEAIRVYDTFRCGKYAKFILKMGGVNTENLPDDVWAYKKESLIQYPIVERKIRNYYFIYKYIHEKVNIESFMYRYVKKHTKMKSESYQQICQQLAMESPDEISINYKKRNKPMDSITFVLLIYSLFIVQNLCL